MRMKKYLSFIPTLTEAELKTDFLESFMEGPESDIGTELDLDNK
jgi:hypothetical protein